MTKALFNLIIMKVFFCKYDLFVDITCSDKAEDLAAWMQRIGGKCHHLPMIVRESGPPLAISNRQLYLHTRPLSDPLSVACQPACPVQSSAEMDIPHDQDKDDIPKQVLAKTKQMRAEAWVL